MRKKEAEARKRSQALQGCLTGTAQLLEAAAQDVTGRLAAGESTVKEVKELADVLKVLVDLEQKLYPQEKAAEQEMVRVVLSEDAEELSR